MTVQFPVKSQDCRQMESLLPPFVDGETSPRDAALVEAHLERCTPCRQLMREQRDVRALLTSRRASLRGAAPFGLESRVRALAGGERASARAGWTRRFSPLAAAAVVVLAIAGGLYWGTGQSSALLAAQLTLDHIKCFLIDGDEHAQSMTAAAGQVQLHEAHGLDVSLPVPREAEGAHLVAVRNCLYGEGFVAHVLYRVHGEPVSMFVLPGRSAAHADVVAFGRHTEVVTRHGVTYVVVAPAQLAGVASALGLEGE